MLGKIMNIVESASKMRLLKFSIVFFIYCTCLSRVSQACQFYPYGEYLRFVRIPENLKVGGEVLRLEVHPRRNLSLQPVDKEEDAHFFTYRDVNRTHVSVVLAQSLEDLVDSDNPQNVLKFRLGCEFIDGEDMISAFLSVTVYVEDVNDHAPKFIETPYQVTVDELTPIGLTIFKSIHAFDRDKPNTPNSDVQYSIVHGNEKGKFALESSHKAALAVKKPLDYDTGDRNFTLTLMATDRGSPAKSTNTTVKIFIQDNDDLSPRFTDEIYRTQITEFYPLTGGKIHRELTFVPPIKAFDQDTGIDTPLRYDLISGNERHLFSLDPRNGSLFLKKEIDLDVERTLPANTFVLQIQASQIDNPLKTALARVEVEVLDLNDNLPEFEVDFYNISIVENLPNGFSVLQVIASDRDQGDNGEFTYQLEDLHGAFSIDPRTGWLTVRDQSVLDREQHSSLKMKVFAKEKNHSVVGTVPNGSQIQIPNHRTPKRRRNPQPAKTPDVGDRTTYIFPDKTGMNKENVFITPNTNELMSFVSVEVTLLDANDNNPIFLPSNLYEFTLKANAKIGDVIGRVKAVDPDLGRNGMVLYDLQRTSNLTITSPFQIEAQTGTLTVAETPLVEGRHALFIEASDQPANPSERRFTLAVVTIEVAKLTRGQKPSAPGFIGAPYEFWVGANVGVGTSIGQIRLTEAMDKNHIIYDLLHSYHEGVPFAVEERSGTITVVNELAKYERALYDFEAVASHDKLDITLVTNVTIHVVDPEDERGILMKGAANTPIEFHVRENMAGALIGQLLYQNSTMAYANSSSKSIRFIIANQQDVTDDIAIGQDGTLYTQKGLDREKREIYRLTVIAEYTKGTISGAGIYQVTIFVDDDNDNAPIFNYHSYDGAILENSAINTEVNMTNFIIAKDADSGENAEFTYSLFGDGNKLFDVDKISGRVYFRGEKLDREEKNMYNLRLVAKDKGNLSSETRINIKIIDENDNAPKFKQIIIPSDEKIEVLEYDESTAKVKLYEEKRSRIGEGLKIATPRSQNKFMDNLALFGPLLSIPETIAVGTTILKLKAEDIDVGSNAALKFSTVTETFIPNFAIMPGKLHIKQYFIVNEQSGDVVISRILPPECEFRLNISVTDGGGLSDQVNVRIFIKDINDHAPVFKKSWYNFDVDEALYSRTILGKVEASDADYGKNANVSYQIIADDEKLPFEISTFSGVLSVNGELDREEQEHYSFSVLAKDNGIEKRLSSTVNVEVHVLDVNDNAPKFYGYDEVLEWSHPEAEEITNHNFESVMMIPVYRASLLENSPIGTKVVKVYANDSDFPGNGNGLLLFDIPRRKNQANLFVIDSKDGIVTTSGKLDYETQTLHNITVIASDLGSPSLSSTALILLKVTDIPENLENTDTPIFSERYYEVEIEENSHTPVELLTLNVTDSYKDQKLRYSIISEDKYEIKKMFVVDPRNGTLYLVRSPDREIRDKYEIIVRAERPKLGRNLPHMIYPVSDEVLEGLTKSDVKIVVNIRDVNDNAPRFTVYGRPIVAAIPTTASFGYEILKLQALDPDLGINSDVRYQILNDQSQRFGIDPISGQVRAVAPFSREAGKVFGFDVKATDRQGADDGKSAIANVFVYVLDESKQLVVVMSAKPIEVEKSMENITNILTSATGMDVRVRKLESHSKSSLDGSATDMYIYAVDPTSNSIIDMDALQRALLLKESDIKHDLPSYQILEVGGSSVLPVKGKYALSALELGVVSLGCIVFLGALTTAICIVCVRRTKRNRHKAFSQQRLNAMGLSTDQLAKIGSLFPTTPGFQETPQVYGEADSYMDMLNSHTMKQVCPHGNTIDEFGQAHQKCVKSQYGSEGHRNSTFLQPKQHDPTCIRFNKRTGTKKRKNGGMETSITSVHSSGQDSGIAEGGRCPCGQSTTQSSEESSNGSYEDSLKSSHKERLTRRSLKHNTRAKELFNEPFSLHSSIIKTKNQKTNASKRRNKLAAYKNTFTDDLTQGSPRIIHKSEFNPQSIMRRSNNNINSVMLPLHPHAHLHTSTYVKGTHAVSHGSVVEPVVDYDQSETEEVVRKESARGDIRRSSNHNINKGSSKLLELSNQQAVFVATPAAAAIMRRQGSERLVIARPM